MLLRFPVEILTLILSQLREQDLLAASYVSKSLYAVAVPLVYRHVVIRPLLDNRLHALQAVTSKVPSPFQHTQHLEISVSPRNAPKSEVLDDDEISKLGNNVLAVLAECKEDALQSFNWDVGTYVPYKILGMGRHLSHHQRQLRSLRLSTGGYSNSSDYDLVAFTELTELAWVGMEGYNAPPALQECISRNARHLRRLELSCGETVFQEAEYLAEVLNLTMGGGGTLLPELRELSVSRFTLLSREKEIAALLNPHSLRSLKLHFCAGWEGFLRRLSSSDGPLCLQTLEIRSDEQYLHPSTDRGAIAALLETTKDLEELFFLGFTPDADACWQAVVHNKATLKAFVYHRRRYDGLDRQGRDDHSPPWQQGHLPTLAGFHNLEFLGLCGLSPAPTPIPHDFLPKVSLRVLHCRQSGGDIQLSSSLGIKAQARGFSGLRDLELERNTAADGSTPGNMEFPTLTDSLDALAEWAFGLDGIPSLGLLAYGDFSFEKTYSETQVLLCRNSKADIGRLGRLPDKNYRHVMPEDRYEMGLFHRYRHALGACKFDELAG